MHVRSGLLVAASVLLATTSLGHACTTDADCDDGNVCNGTETCAAGSCLPGTPAVNGMPCSDSNPCNGMETCQAGTCTPGYPLNCTDGNPDTMEWCDPLTGCRHQLITAFRSCDEPATAAFAWADAHGVCPCDQNRPHGEYVRCVARAAADAFAGTLPRNCRGAVKRCAARSTCGKPSGSVTCCLARPGSCEGGLCQDGVTPCSQARDCQPRTQCSLKPSAEACTARGGSPGSGGSCCDQVCYLP